MSEKISISPASPGSALFSLEAISGKVIGTF